MLLINLTKLGRFTNYKQPIQELVMVSRKGIAVTIGILATITLSSFIIWIIPQNSGTSYVVSDFENHLDGIKQIHNIITEDVEKEFQNVVDGKITPDEYIQIAEISSSQINSQIILIVESRAVEEWQESYINYMESLKQTNSYIRETIVAANMIKEGVEEGQLDGILYAINEIKS